MPEESDAGARFGIVRVNLTGRVLAIDGGFSALLGVPPEAAVGRQVADFTDKPNGGSPQMMINILVRTGEPMSIRRVFVHPDGSRLTCWVQLCLLRDGAGRPESVIGIGQVAPAEAGT